MGYIYKIVNDINDKIYIGKTCATIEERFKEHLRDCQVREKEKRPLYLAMKKYGVEHFTIQQIEQCNDADLELREKYWVDYYNSYFQGYNATLGGDGKLLYNHEEILCLLKDGKKPQEIAEKFGCCVLTVYLIARHNGIKLVNPLKEQMLVSKKTVYQYDKQNNFLQEFESVNEAARWVIKNNISKSNINGTSGKICNCANNKAKSAYGFIWKYSK